MNWGTLLVVSGLCVMMVGILSYILRPNRKTFVFANYATCWGAIIYIGGCILREYLKH